MRYLDGNKIGEFIFLRCSGQGSVECRICGNLTWSSNAYARINRDNGYDYYCIDCMYALKNRRDETTDPPSNKRELEYIKTKGIELW